MCWLILSRDPNALEGPQVPVITPTYLSSVIHILRSPLTAPSRSFVAQSLLPLH